MHGPEGPDQNGMRVFETGATRNTDQNKIDYEGFLSPIVLRRFGEYMNKHRVQADGQLRDSDNWQKGIPMDAYMKSMYRHFMDVWASHRGAWGADMEESLCALLFNGMGYLHERLKAKPFDVKDLKPGDRVKIKPREDCYSELKEAVKRSGGVAVVEGEVSNYGCACHADDECSYIYADEIIGWA